METEARMMPISAATMRKYDCHTPSIWPSILMPATRVIVTKIMTPVRHRESTSGTFCVHLTWIFQMRLTGIDRTRYRLSNYLPGVDRQHLLSKSPITSTAVRPIPYRRSLATPEGTAHLSNDRISIATT